MTGAVSGIVLAGGPGRRLGAPKATVALHGQRLVERATAILAARCAEVVVVSRPEIALPALPATRVVFDRPGPDAPLTALATGLAAARSDACLVLACDLPFAAPLVDRILGMAPGAAFGVDLDGRPQPLCGRYPTAATLAACDALLGDGAIAMRDLLARIRWVGVAARGDELLNINSLADLARAHQAGSTSTTAL